MEKQIKFLKAKEEEVSKNGKSYKVLTVSFFDHEKGKVDAKKLFSFSADKTVWRILSSASNGDVFSVKQEKDDNGYFVWTEVTPMAKDTSESKSQRVPFETPEERAARQVYIIRQSSIASAVELLKERKTATPEEVLGVARVFEAYVLGVNTAAQPEEPTFD